MLKKEFEYYAGYEVSDDDYYNVIEPMYMAVKLDKEEFVKTLNKKRFVQPTANDLVKQMKKLAEKFAEANDNGEWVRFELENELTDLAHKYGERFFHIGIDPHNEWCYIQKRYCEWTGRISSIVFEVGRLGKAKATIVLYER